MKEIVVLAVNISEEKGTIKKPVDHIILNEKGVENDAHAGDWHRQLSLLAAESISRFEVSMNRKINFGEFAENISTQGLELKDCKPGDLFYNETIRLEVTQIGKSCHGSNCEIFKEVGNCVMPKEGIFARVISGGVLKAGDKLWYQPINLPNNE
ncbi:MAG: hypothetical protein Q7J34_12875 [Bacteroidales bacterium]|jgi:MOSC domain-containing protein YiiM|nr:hypothetical protein [Bacteroidales bacterium]